MGRVVVSDGPMFTFSVEKLGNMHFLHFDCKKWSPSIYKLYKKMFDMFLKESRLAGIDKVHVAIPDNDLKLLKFERMFGFEIVSKYPGVLILERTTET